MCIHYGLHVWKLCLSVLSGDVNVVKYKGHVPLQLLVQSKDNNSFLLAIAPFT